MLADATWLAGSVQAKSQRGYGAISGHELGGFFASTMMQIIGEIHRTRDGRSFYIDYAQIIPEAGAYDVVLFGLRRDEEDFSMAVAFPEESFTAWGAHESLVREGLVRVRAQLDHGVEEDGSLIEVPIAAGGGWRPTYRMSGPRRMHHA